MIYILMVEEIVLLIVMELVKIELQFQKKNYVVLFMNIIDLVMMNVQ